MDSGELTPLSYLPLFTLHYSLFGRRRIISPINPVLTTIIKKKDSTMKSKTNLGADDGGGTVKSELSNLPSDYAAWLKYLKMRVHSA
ncbi:hypothetical protein FACS1894139_15510 [Planctomycetales bacterium]|nr:hypothetical protein FACS1894107_04780 [Planctomycetales bacterium]GHS98848.1 hypothetical protein FACS1894108_07730 [Planctomycetales bacterium]GHT07353.1 hypothetical protein FACS1894139_15510 [Planctomycetales bacterium]